MSDMWSLITGLASLLSFILYYVDRFPTHKAQLFLACSFLVGFTFSRVVYTALPSTIRNLSLVPVLMAVLVATVLGFVFFLFRKNEIYMAWMILLFFILPLFYGIRDVLSAPAIPPGDYLILAREKEKTSDLSGAINYFEMYLRKLPLKRDS